MTLRWLAVLVFVVGLAWAVWCPLPAVADFVVATLVGVAVCVLWEWKEWRQ
jgi:hypothetical protein